MRLAREQASEREMEGDVCIVCSRCENVICIHRRALFLFHIILHFHFSCTFLEEDDGLRIMPLTQFVFFSRAEKLSRGSGCKLLLLLSPQMDFFHFFSCELGCDAILSYLLPPASLIIKILFSFCLWTSLPFSTKTKIFLQNLVSRGSSFFFFFSLFLLCFL